MTSIEIGPREEVGKESLGSKAARRTIGSVIGGVLGSGGRGSSALKGPRTRRDPTRRLDYVKQEKSKPEITVGARSRWTDDGLLVSTRISDHEEKGTYHSIYLQSCDGRRLYPRRLEIYDLWAEHSLTVSWTRTTYVDGQVVSQASGGWSDSWSEFLGRHPVNETELPGIWQMYGYDRAHSGIQQLGAYFNLDPEQLAELGDLALIAHVTRPEQDPVITEPFDWMIGVDESGEFHVSPGDAPVVTEDGRESTARQHWLRNCEVVSQAPVAAALTASDEAPAARTGYPLPPDVVVSTPVSTGRTTGHIADINVRNDGTEPVVFPGGPYYIPSTGRYQGYVGAPGRGTTVPPGTTVAVPVEAYCSDVRHPPVPAGEPLPPVDEWVVPGDPAAPVTVPPRASAGAPGRVVIPGTGEPVPRAVDPDIEPLVAAPLLFRAIHEIERVTAELQETGELQTPFSGNPDREREAVVQQTFWLFAAELSGKTYTREEFTQRLEEQHAERTGIPVTSAPPEERERLQEGADDFWGAFELVGAKAEVLQQPETLIDTPAETVPDEGKPPPSVAAAPGCVPDDKFEHTPKTVDVQISESYGNEEERQKIHKGIKKAVEDAEEAYATSMPPATAYSLWGHDHIGGISSGYAKTIFLEDDGRDWVWSTEPLSTTAKGTGTHTLSFAHGPECTSVVAGAAQMWIKSASEAFDPLERDIEVIRALDAVKKVTVKYLAGKLPPGLDEALEAGVEAITDQSSDTYAAATGTATLQVGDDEDAQTSANRVVYKREDKEDKAIIGGGETIRKLSASDHKPGSLTSRLDAESKLEAGATGNGLAKAWLESLYGTILIGVCECPDSIRYKITTDNGQFIRSKGAKAAIERAIREMNEAAERIGKDIESGDLEPTGDALEERAEAELEAWGESIGGDRFEPEEAAATDEGGD